ncbi:MAG: phosphoribosylglycinamide formyltransferase [Algiphilus sp.]
MTARLCVLVSGRGRNLRALHAACADGRIEGDIVQVVCNQPQAAAVDFAQQAGIAYQVLDHRDFATRAEFDTALADVVEASQPDWVVLAGFMRVLGADFVQRFQGRMLNIHPSLLPRHRGLHTHRSALAAGDAEHGASVHFVTDELDGGPVIVQGACRVKPDDDEAGLAERVMSDIELRIYPQAVAWACAGRVLCRQSTVYFDGAPLRAPLDMTALEEGF